MHIYLKNICGTFRPNPFCNDRTLGFSMKWHHGRYLESMTSYTKSLGNNHAKFHPNPIWNDKAIGLLSVLPQLEAQVQEQQDE